jgi:excisionase family DNA binding protein
VKGNEMKLLQFPYQKSNFDRGQIVITSTRSYLSTVEVSQLFGFSVRTITAWAAAWHESGGTQGIPAFKMGRSWRFDRKEIQTYIDGKKLPLQQIERKTATA